MINFYFYLPESAAASASWTAALAKATVFS
jgi:hypothetical protein